MSTPNQSTGSTLSGNKRPSLEASLPPSDCAAPAGSSPAVTSKLANGTSTGDADEGHRHGNFPNYYSFHAVSERTDILGREGMRSIFGLFDGVSRPCDADESKERPLLLCDIGCNSGDLTIAVLKAARTHTGRKVFALGVDIDAVLIERAKIASVAEGLSPSECTFLSGDVASKETEPQEDAEGAGGAGASGVAQQGLLGEMRIWLSEHNATHFDCISLFSVTMWIHVHCGDQGLQRTISRMTTMCNHLLIEPQPWKCYKTAKFRLRRQGRPQLPAFTPDSGVTIDGHEPEKAIDAMVTRCEFGHRQAFGVNQWGRGMWLYHRPGHGPPMSSSEESTNTAST